MKYSWDDAVRKTFARAVEEAVRLRHDYVGTEHMLLALAGMESGAVLRRIGVEPAEVTARLHESVRSGTRTVQPGKGGLPYTSRMKQALALAMEVSREQGDESIGREHLLLGLIREEKGIAAQVLASLGVDEETAARRVRGALPATRVESRFRVRIDDTSSASIYEQIIARVQEAVATGELSSGDRLPTVRQLADELDIAPGTVARAYGELERLGVVVTEGVRGTRIADRRRAALANGERTETLTGLLRPVVVAAFHLGASADELRAALEPAMSGIFTDTAG